MKTKKIFILIIAFSLLYSCNQNKKDDSKWIIKKNISLSEANLIIYEHVVTFNGQKRIDLFCNSSRYKIIDAFVYCNIDSICCLDSLTSKLIGCNKGLYMIDDTVEIFINPKLDSSVKNKTNFFPKVTVLFRDKIFDTYYISDTTFTYTF